MIVNNQLQQKYNGQYENDSDEWRMLGGKGKAKNLIEITKGISFTKILDIGSGDGSVLFWLDQNGFCNDITSVEISQSGIEKIKSRNLKSVKDILLFDGYKLPFDNDSFDLAMCSHVIEHVEFPRMLIREITRVSKKQVFEVPIDFSLNVDRKVNHFLSYGHINIFTPQTFRFLLKTEGLEIESFSNKLYEKEIHDYMYRDQSFIKKIKLDVKRYIRKNTPFLMNLKPNVTTVRTSKTAKNIEIMEQ